MNDDRAAVRLKKCDLVAELSALLDEEFREQALRDGLQRRLAALRLLYREDRDAFSPQDIEYLRSVRTVTEAVDEFIELIPELVTVREMNGYLSARVRLSELRKGVGDAAVRKRIDREIRQLDEGRPGFLQATRLMRECRRHARMAELKRRAPFCGCYQRMILREGPHGVFWACRRFPKCQHTRNLTHDDQMALDAIDKIDER